MNLLLGEKRAERYTDRGILRSELKGNKYIDCMMVVRLIWMRVRYFFGSFMTLETEVCKNIAFGAWKIHILAVKNK